MRILAILLAASLTACASAGNEGRVGAKAGAPTVFAVDDDGVFTSRAAIWFASDPVKATKAAKARMLSEARRNGFTHFTLQGFRSYLFFGQHVFLQGKFFRPGAAPSEALPLDSLAYASVNDDGTLVVASVEPPVPAKKPVKKVKRAAAPKPQPVHAAAPAAAPAPVAIPAPAEIAPPAEPVKAVAPVETKAQPAALEKKAQPVAPEKKAQPVAPAAKLKPEAPAAKPAPVEAKVEAAPPAPKPKPVSAPAAKADEPIVIEAPEFIEDPLAPKKPVR